MQSNSFHVVSFRYSGLYLKDLTFITDGNPDRLTNGLINLSKRRQVQHQIGIDFAILTILTAAYNMNTGPF